MMQKTLKHRFWIAFAVAVVWGTYIGVTYSYKSLFAGNGGLYPFLIWPSVLIGLLSGWKTIVNCLMMYLVTASILFTRALLGRDLWWDYVTFVFQLTFGSVVDIIPLGLFCAYVATIIVAATIYLIRKKKRPNHH